MVQLGLWAGMGLLGLLPSLIVLGMLPRPEGASRRPLGATGVAGVLIARAAHCLCFLGSEQSEYIKVG